MKAPITSVFRLVKGIERMIERRMPLEQSHRRESYELLLSQAIAIVSGSIPETIVADWLARARATISASEGTR